jgi:hypothetical protein
MNPSKKKPADPWGAAGFAVSGLSFSHALRRTRRSPSSFCESARGKFE